MTEAVGVAAGMDVVVVVAAVGVAAGVDMVVAAVGMVVAALGMAAGVDMVVAAVGVVVAVVGKVAQSGGSSIGYWQTQLYIQWTSTSTVRAPVRNPQVKG